MRVADQPANEELFLTRRYEAGAGDRESWRLGSAGDNQKM